MRTLHFDCMSGISGDMALGALVDLGYNDIKVRNSDDFCDPNVDFDATEKFVRQQLGLLGLENWSLEFRAEKRASISGKRALVTVGGENHEHRRWVDIEKLLKNSSLAEGVKRRSLAIFGRLAAAEAAVHGVPEAEAVFHEAGALDSIIDIVGVSAAIESLAPEEITASRVELGGGAVQCAHGMLPVPAPAVELLLKGVPVSTGASGYEMTTPTGAAILAACAASFDKSARFTQGAVGVGLGSREIPGQPNALRASLRFDAKLAVSNTESDTWWITETLVLVETNIDDMTGEALGFLMERLFEIGALDVTLTPCTMKKSRPGTIVTCLCDQKHLEEIRQTLFLESSTLGFRETLVTRQSLPRERHKVKGAFGAEGWAKTAISDGRNKTKVEAETRALWARQHRTSLDEA